MADEEVTPRGSRLDSDEEELSEKEDGIDVRKLTLSDILLTPQEKRARQEYRLKASNCCVKEAWRMYRRVTNSENAIEPANLNLEKSNEKLITRMGVLYDPTAGMRMRFLKNKFAHLLTGFRSIREAAYKPFIRVQKPQKMDIAGQGKAMPAVAKAYHPEVYVTYTHPSTFAFRENWTKIFNSNFVTKEDMLRDMEDRDAQTMPFEVYSTSRIHKEDQPRDTSVEKFDVEDIPLDSDGNPIGRSVGICEWCGKSILPFPSTKTLDSEWNIESLYCCDRYRLYVEEIARVTQVIETEYEGVNMRINIESKRSKSSQRKLKRSFKDERKSKMNKSDRSRPGSHVHVVSESPSQQPQFNFDKFSQSGKDKFKSDIGPPPYSDKGVDTFDLPWHPAETRMAQAKRMYNEANDPEKELLTGGGFPDTKTTLTDIAILLGLEEVYTSGPTIEEEALDISRRAPDKPSPIVPGVYDTSNSSFALAESFSSVDKEAARDISVEDGLTPPETTKERPSP